MFTFKVSTKYGFVKAGDVNVGITSGNADILPGLFHSARAAQRLN